VYVQLKHGFEFESETDTETIPKLMKHIYDGHKERGGIKFSTLAERVVQQLVSHF
jgi:glucosamine--fructose-6-phosphate aminotransferase (isomerizing)